MDDINQPDGGQAPESVPEAPKYASKDELASIQAQFAEQNQKMQQLMEQILASRQAPQPAKQESKKLSDVLFDDADEAARIIEERAARRAEEQVTKRFQASQATQQAVSEVAIKYPEFGQPGSEAANLAVQRANSLPQHLRGTPEGARLVMLEVASELGLVPASKRKQQQAASDDFAIGGNPAPSRRSADPVKDVDPRTLAFAQLMGVDITDPKRLEGLKKSQKRNWNKYE